MYQSKRSSQIKRDQHTSLPYLSESLANDSNTSYNNNETLNHTVPSSTNSSVSTMALTSPTSPTLPDSKQIDTNHERTQSISASTGQPSSPNATPKSPRKTVRKLISTLCSSHYYHLFLRVLNRTFQRYFVHDKTQNPSLLI